MYTQNGVRMRRIQSNGIPKGMPTGKFPVQPGTPAYSYYHAATGDSQTEPTADLIPIKPYDLDVSIPVNPIYGGLGQAMQSLVLGVITATGGIPIHANFAGTTVKGRQVWFDPAQGLPLDQCWGHPYNDEYHHHAYSWRCFPDAGKATAHSPLVGYAMDGFGLYGPRGVNGAHVTNNDLDNCHGHTHQIVWDGVVTSMYHYHLNNEYPYGPGCYQGTTQAYFDAFIPNQPPFHNH